MEKRVYICLFVHLQQGYETFHPPTQGMTFQTLNPKPLVLVDEKFHNLVVDGQTNIYIYNPLWGGFQTPKTKGYVWLTSLSTH
jgi:hypothetical protein